MMSRDEAERMAERLRAMGWEAGIGTYNVWGTRWYVLAYHLTLGSYRVESERGAAMLIAHGAKMGGIDG